MKEIKLEIKNELDNRTVKEILFSNLLLTSRLVTSLKKTDGILLNGEAVTVRKVVKAGDVLTVRIKSEQSDNILPNNIPLDILYEDEDILAVNKPKDMPTHPSLGHYEGTLANAVMYYFKGTDFMFRAVNRLDRDTTGIVLVAKNQYAAAYLNKQITNREIKKMYLAICCGVPKEEHGIIEAPIKREDDSVIKRVVAPDGQYAKSEYWVVNRKDGFSLVKLKPYTGRTHQLRVHLAHINTPIYSDFIYGDEIKGERTRLHCYSMEFKRPSDEETILINAPIPEDFFIK